MKAAATLKANAPVVPGDRPPARICLIRLSAIGDTCHVLPVVRTLQCAWPETAITWIIGRTEAQLLGDVDGIEFVVFDKSAGWRGLYSVRAQLAGRRFAVLLHMQTSMRANLISALVDAEVRVGFDRARAREFQWLFTNRRIAAVRQQHVMDAMFEFARAVGVEDRVLRWDIPVPEAAARFAAEVMVGGSRWLLISPCANPRFRNFRNWRAERYAAVADHAWREYGCRTVLTGGGSATEQQFAAQILATARQSSIVDLVGRTTLKELFALIRRADVVVCPDSGPAHMATAAGTPVIGLYATTNPLRAGPYLSSSLVVSRYHEAMEGAGRPVEAARWGARVRDAEAMDLIAVEDVTARLARVLGVPPHAG